MEEEGEIVTSIEAETEAPPPSRAAWAVAHSTATSAGLAVAPRASTAVPLPLPIPLDGLTPETIGAAVATVMGAREKRERLAGKLGPSFPILSVYYCRVK